MEKQDIKPKTLEEHLTMVEMHNLYHSHEVAGDHCRVCGMRCTKTSQGWETVSLKGNTYVYDYVADLKGHPNPLWALAWYVKAREFNIVDKILELNGRLVDPKNDEHRSIFLRYFNPVYAMREKTKPQAYARAAFIFAKRVAADDETRRCACADPQWAFEYAMKVDGGVPDAVTRTACARHMETAVAYSEKVDVGYHIDTLKKVLEDEEQSFNYLKRFGIGKDKKPNEIVCKAVKGTWVKNSAAALKYAKIMGAEDDTRDLVNKSKVSQDILYYAIHEGTPRDDSRQALIDTGEAADIYSYALRVDKGPHDGTRAAVLSCAMTAAKYAATIDKAPRDDTRTAACKLAHHALYYAEAIDKKPCDETRAAASRLGSTAIAYAKVVDKFTPHQVTRLGACRDEFSALEYARDVDRAATDETVYAVARSGYHAYRYAECLGDHPVLRESCLRDPDRALAYAKSVDKAPSNDTRAVAYLDIATREKYDAWEKEYYKAFIGQLFAASEEVKEEIKQ